MAHDVGDRVTVTTTVTVEGVATNATMAILVTSPSGTTSTPTISNPSTGVYKANIDATEAGVWLYKWTASGAVVSTQIDQFTVRAPGARLLSLTEAKTHLNIPLTVTVNDEELRNHLDATTAIVETLCGAMIPRTVVETYSGEGAFLVLRTPPAISITTVVEDTVTLSAADYTLDAEVGTLARRSATWLRNWVTGYHNITVTYLAGRTIIPPNVNLAAQELVAHLWRNSQYARSGRKGAWASTTPGGAADDSVTLVGIGYSVPARVLELLQGDRLPPVLMA